MEDTNKFFWFKKIQNLHLMKMQINFFFFFLLKKI